MSGAAGAAAVDAVAPSNWPGRQGEEEEEEGGQRGRGGVLQRDPIHAVSDEALFCLTLQKTASTTTTSSKFFQTPVRHLGCVSI